MVPAMHLCQNDTVFIVFLLEIHFDICEVVVLQSLVFAKFSLVNEVAQFNDNFVQVIGDAPFFIPHYFQINVFSVVQINKSRKFCITEHLWRTERILHVQQNLKLKMVF